jgi:glycosyltransferase involved in cell wall biosynthesis
VTLLWGEMTEAQLADLYRACDTFVLPTRAEGWGLPLIEAVAAGMPIITTRYSGHMEFLQHVADSVLPVAHVMTRIDCAEYCSYYPEVTNDWGVWAQPDLNSLVACMQQAPQQEQELYDRAQRNSAIIRERFSWSQSAEQALACMGI